MYKLKNILSHIVYQSLQKPVYDSGQFGWRVDGNTILLDSGKEFTLTNTLIPVIALKLRYHAQDRVYLESLRGTNPAIADLFELLEDPRTEAVDVGNQSVIDGTVYAIGLCALHFSYSEQERIDRLASILAESVEV